MQPTQRQVEGTQGLQLNVLEWSEEGVPLALLHGFANDAHIWDDFAPVVAPYYRTLALDHRGHGDSDWDPDGRYDPESLVNDLEAVLKNLSIERLVLVGHSLGGRVATLFAGRHPERVAGLVIVDIGPEVNIRGRMRIRQGISAARNPVFESTAAYARALSLAYPAAQPAAIQRMATHGVRRRADGRFTLKTDPKMRERVSSNTLSQEEQAAFEASAERAQWDALATLPCPALVVRGAASDILSPEVADRMVDDVLQNGRLAVIPQAGHSVMTDNPDAFQKSVADFVLTE